MASCVRPALMLLVLLFVLPSAVAQEAPDERVLDEAAECARHLEAYGADRDVTSCVVAYAHTDSPYFGLLNTQRPPEDIGSYEIGSNQPVITPYWDLNSHRFELQAGPVEYRDQEIQMGYHGGFGRALALAEYVPLHTKVHFTIDQTQTSLSGAHGLGAGVLPCVTVEVRLVAGARGAVEEVLSETITTGHLTRPGAIAPSLPCADESTFSIDEDGVTTFDLLLAPASRSIVHDEHVALEVIAYNAEHDGTEASGQGIRLVQDPDHLNMIVLPVHDPLRVDVLRPLWYEGMLYIMTNITSVFGDYDVDREGLDLQILDPDGKVVVARSTGGIAEPTIRYATHHDRPDIPVQAVFEYDLAAAGLPDGRYTLQVVAQNQQRLIQATAEEKLVITNDGARLILYTEDGSIATWHDLRETEEAPGHFASAMLALLCLALLARAGPRARRL